MLRKKITKQAKCHTKKKDNKSQIGKEKDE